MDPSIESDTMDQEACLVDRNATGTEVVLKPSLVDEKIPRSEGMSPNYSSIANDSQDVDEPRLVIDDADQETDDASASDSQGNPKIPVWITAREPTFIEQISNLESELSSSFNQRFVLEKVLRYLRDVLDENMFSFVREEALSDSQNHILEKLCNKRIQNGHTPSNNQSMVNSKDTDVKLGIVDILQWLKGFFSLIESQNGIRRNKNHSYSQYTLKNASETKRCQRNGIEDIDGNITRLTKEIIDMKSKIQSPNANMIGDESSSFNSNNGRWSQQRNAIDSSMTKEKEKEIIAFQSNLRNSSTMKGSLKAFNGKEILTDEKEEIRNLNRELNDADITLNENLLDIRRLKQEKQELAEKLEYEKVKYMQYAKSVRTLQQDMERKKNEKMFNMNQKVERIENRNKELMRQIHQEKTIVNDAKRVSQVLSEKTTLLDNSYIIVEKLKAENALLIKDHSAQLVAERKKLEGEKNKVDLLNQQYVQLQYSNNRQQSKEFEKYEAERSGFENHVKQLNEQIKELKVEGKDLRKKLDTSEEKIRDLKKKLDTSEQKRRDQRKKLDSLENKKSNTLSKDDLANLIACGNSGSEKSIDVEELKNKVHMCIEVNQKMLEKYHAKIYRIKYNKKIYGKEIKEQTAIIKNLRLQLKEKTSKLKKILKLKNNQFVKMNAEKAKAKSLVSSELLPLETEEKERTQNLIFQIEELDKQKNNLVQNIDSLDKEYQNHKETMSRRIEHYENESATLKENVIKEKDINLQLKEKLKLAMEKDVKNIRSLTAASCENKETMRENELKYLAKDICLKNNKCPGGDYTAETYTEIEIGNERQPEIKEQWLRDTNSLLNQIEELKNEKNHLIQDIKNIDNEYANYRDTTNVKMEMCKKEAALLKENVERLERLTLELKKKIKMADDKCKADKTTINDLSINNDNLKMELVEKEAKYLKFREQHLILLNEKNICISNFKQDRKKFFDKAQRELNINADNDTINDVLDELLINIRRCERETELLNQEIGRYHTVKTNLKEILENDREENPIRLKETTKKNATEEKSEHLNQLDITQLAGIDHAGPCNVLYTTDEGTAIDKDKNAQNVEANPNESYQMVVDPEHKQPSTSLKRKYQDVSNQEPHDTAEVTSVENQLRKVIAFERGESSLMDLMIERKSIKDLMIERKAKKLGGQGKVAVKEKSSLNDVGKSSNMTQKILANDFGSTSNAPSEIDRDAKLKTKKMSVNEKQKNKSAMGLKKSKAQSRMMSLKSDTHIVNVKEQKKTTAMEKVRFRRSKILTRKTASKRELRFVKRR